MCINPGFILGPNINKVTFSSGQIVSKVIKGIFPGIPHINFAVVDIRDVAEAHLKALVVDKAKNNRFILVNEPLWFIHAGKWLHQKFGNKYMVAHYPLPKFAMYLG